MKEWIVIHKIKSLYDNGNGLTERQIAKELSLSRNTVSKYLHMPETKMAQQLGDMTRVKKLDAYRVYIIQLLQTYPGLSAVKVMRKLKAKVDSLDVSDRSVRRYIQTLKDEISFKQPRYYEPVVDRVPGVQCQVDGGELRGVMIGGKETTVYFMVFVLSYSRLMHVSVSTQPIDTQALIYQHDAAFRYFGGRPQECVYDQTKLVVIHEIFRELELNQRFHQYATGAGFHIRACEGYDPESKGKVESGVKYVKQNGLYGETFTDWKSLETYLADWLDTVANKRVHGTTGQQPWILYDPEEKVKMQPYLTSVRDKDHSKQGKKNICPNIKGRSFFLIGISEQTSHDIDHAIGQRPMARMLNLRNVFELVINGFNDAAFSQQNLIEQGDDFGLHVFLELGDQFNVVHGQKFSELF